MKSVLLAPLRGITDVVFRNAFHHHFAGITEAVAPFVTSVGGRRVKASHLRDLVPAENRRMRVVPQILSRDDDAFVRLANTLVDQGYDEINWNLGCPYPMVAKKMRGSGLLCHPQRIDRMLERIVPGVNAAISVKTRLGRFDALEMETLIPIFNRYPLKRVIVHPRTGIQMYDGSVDLSAFERCLRTIVHPVVYNGDITSADDFQRMEIMFPDVSGWMLGRGLVADPFLAERIQNCGQPIDRRRTRFAAFHAELLEMYGRRFSGPGHVLDRMKGLWRYFGGGIGGGQDLWKRIRKASSIGAYRQLVDAWLNAPEAWGEG